MGRILTVAALLLYFAVSCFAALEENTVLIYFSMKRPPMKQQTYPSLRITGKSPMLNGQRTESSVARWSLMARVVLLKCHITTVSSLEAMN